MSTIRIIEIDYLCIRYYLITNEINKYYGSYKK
jgi:hypothetical protein